MSIKLYVGNISWGATDEAVRELFEPFGEIEDFFYAIDRMTGRFRGFCLITYAQKAEGERAIEEMNGYELEGRALVVNVARPKEDHGPRESHRPFGSAGDRRDAGFRSRREAGDSRREGGFRSRRGGGDSRGGRDAGDLSSGD